VKSETVAYSTATGARVWAATYPPHYGGGPGNEIAVSPDGAQVYIGLANVTIAYSAGTGRQLWVSHSKNVNVLGLAVSPDGTTVYEAGGFRVPGRGFYMAVIAYDAASGRQRWLRVYNRVGTGDAVALAVSPDGSTVYVAGEVAARLSRSFSLFSLLVFAYTATGTLKWVTRYVNRYTGGHYAGGAFAGPIVLGRGGNALYVAGHVSSKAGHQVAATFAFRAATGECLWMDPDRAPGGGKDSVTPDGKTVIFVGDRTGEDAGYAVTSYDASNGATRWARRAPVPGGAGIYADGPPITADGIVIDPHGDTAYVASREGYREGYDLAAWSVARGTVLWTTSYATAEVFSPVAIVLSQDGTRLYVTGKVGINGGMATVAYRT
jgi:putative hemolysin